MWIKIAYAVAAAEVFFIFSFAYNHGSDVVEFIHRWIR